MVRIHEKKRFTASNVKSRETFVELKRPYRLVKMLRRLLESGSERKIESMLVRLHPADIAQILTSMPVADARKLIQILFRLRKGAATVSELPAGYIEDIVRGFEPKMIAEFARRVEPDDAADILQELPEDKLQEVLDILDIEEVAELKALLAYEEDSAGAIMNPDFFALSGNLTVAEATEQVRRQGDRLRNVVDIYLVDAEARLTGQLSMRDLLLAGSESHLSDISTSKPVAITDDVPEEEVADIMARYDLFAVPVIDDQQRLIGAVTIDDIVDVLKEAATEDIYQMVALDEDDRVFSSPGRSVVLRLPWLLINFATATVAAFTVGVFEGVITQVVALAAMMPIVAGLGGNAGSQTMTVVIRGMALGELSPANAKKAVFKEITVGVINGVILGVVGTAFGWLWKGYWWLGLLLGSAILLNLFMAAIVGALVPLALKRIQLDPALASHIFLTMMTDAFGFFSFLGLAAWLLPILGVI